MNDQPMTSTLGTSARWEAHAVRGAAARKLQGVEPQVEPQSGSIRNSAPAPEASREAEIVGLVLNGYLDTEIRSRLAGAPPSDRYRWSFGPGVDRPEPLRWVPSPVRNELAHLPDAPNCRLSLGWIDGERRHHLAPGRATLAHHLIRRSAGASRRDLVQAASGLGALLRHMGRLDSTSMQQLPAPSGPRRLAHWLRTGDGPWAAGIMHDRLISLLGSARTEEIISWVDEVPRDQLVHGRAGLAATVLSESAAPSALLTGDEIAYGPRDFDLAWVLGELLVSKHMTRYLPNDEAARQRQLITDCRDAFLVGYGPSKDLVTTGRTTSLRVLLEIHDAAAYLDRMLDDLASQAAELVDCAR